MRQSLNKYEWMILQPLTHEQLEMLVCVLSTVAADGLVLKHRAISIHYADQIDIHFIGPASYNDIKFMVKGN